MSFVFILLVSVSLVQPVLLVLSSDPERKKRLPGENATPVGVENTSIFCS